MNKIIAHRHHISLYLVRKGPQGSFFFSYSIMFFFFTCSQNVSSKKRVKIIITALEYEKKK